MNELALLLYSTENLKLVTWTLFTKSSKPVVQRVCFTVRISIVTSHCSACFECDLLSVILNSDTKT